MVTQINFPPAFAFSQSSLQDYLDCARRFQLRYLMQQEWPAPAAEPLAEAEQADLLGKRFHRLVERYWLGLPIERAQLEEPLRGWWEAFLQNPIPDLPPKRRPEVHTSAVLHGQRLIAAFDLLAYTSGSEAVIVDWKTSKRRSPRQWLERRMQTILYPLMLVESAPRLLGYAIKPEQVRLIYWFANAPSEIEVIQYSAERHTQAQKLVATTLDRLLATDETIWPLTTNEMHCRLCQYRSLCNRGVVAGQLDEAEIEAVEAMEAAGDVMQDEYVL